MRQGLRPIHAIPARRREQLGAAEHVHGTDAYILLSAAHRSPAAELHDVRDRPALVEKVAGAAAAEGVAGEPKLGEAQQRGDLADPVQHTPVGHVEHQIVSASTTTAPRQIMCHPQLHHHILDDDPLLNPMLGLGENYTRAPWVR